MSEPSELGQCLLRAPKGFLQQGSGAFVTIRLRRRQREPDVVRDGEEPLLSTVVQVTLEPASFRITGLDDPGA